MNNYNEILEESVKALKEENPDWSHKNDWFYEGNVSRVLVEYLESQSYKCNKDNSNNIHAHGADIIVSKNGIKEVIEVKGYPSDKHAKGNKKGEPKLSTSPQSQVKHWLADCLRSTFSNYKKHKEKGCELQLAICFPDDDKGDYRKLIDEIKPFFSDGNLGIKVYFVNKEGKVNIDNLNTNLQLEQK